MQPTAAQIETLRKDFGTMKSKDDLLGLLNTAKRQLDGSEFRAIEMRSLNYYTDPRLCSTRYKSFTVKKKSGGERVIHSPARGLKSILKAVNHVLQCLYEPHRAAMGFVRNKSIRDNAAQHIGALYVYNLDLKDFFHAFDRNRVKMGLMSEPFGLRGESEPLAFLLASLCTHPFELGSELRTVLPQGSPTSPTITNILCRTLDRRLTGLAKRFGIKYTRYADDITFSSMTNVFRTEDFQTELKRIIEEDQLLVINPSKTRLQTEYHRQEVTGLTVNEKVNVPRRYVKQVRMYLHYWEKYGYDKANSIMARDYPNDRGHDLKRVPALENVLHGKLLYLKMVKGESDGTFRGLNQRFISLSQSPAIIEKPVVSVIATENERVIVKSGPALSTHDPALVVSLLKRFSEHNHPLKYTIHAWDEREWNTFDAFIQAVNSYEPDFRPLFGINRELYFKIRKFIFQIEPTDFELKYQGFQWGRHGIKVGWQYPSVARDFALENYDNLKERYLSPMAAKIPRELRPKDRIYGRTVLHFEYVAELFRQEIQFIGDELYWAIVSAQREVHPKMIMDAKPLKTLGSISIFTDTEKIERAVKRIFTLSSTS